MSRTAVNHNGGEPQYFRERRGFESSSRKCGAYCLLAARVTRSQKVSCRLAPFVLELRCHRCLGVKHRPALGLQSIRVFVLPATDEHGHNNAGNRVHGLLVGK